MKNGAGDGRAVIVGELATRGKSSGKTIETAFAIVPTISESEITPGSCKTRKSNEIIQ
jgi:hypothetical protein